MEEVLNIDNIKAAATEILISPQQQSCSTTNEDVWKDIDDLDSASSPDLAKGDQQHVYLTGKPEATMHGLLPSTKVLMREASQQPTSAAKSLNKSIDSGTSEHFSISKASKSASVQKDRKIMEPPVLRAPEVGISAPVKRPRGRPRKAPQPTAAGLHTKAKAKGQTANITLAAKVNEAGLPLMTYWIMNPISPPLHPSTTK